MKTSVVSIFATALLAASALASEAPFLQSDHCPHNYRQVNKFCFHLQSQFSIESENSLTTIYVKQEGENQAQEQMVHHVAFTVLGTVPGTQQKVPIQDIPVEIVPGEADQEIFVIDPLSGELVDKKILAFSRHTSKTNSQGRIGVSFAINKAKNLRLQKMMVRSSFMEVTKYLYFRGDSAALQSLSKIETDTLLQLNPDLDEETAQQASQTIQALMKITQNTPRQFQAENDGSLNLYDVPVHELNMFDDAENAAEHFTREQEKVDQEWQDIEQENIQEIKVVYVQKARGDGIVKAIIRTGKRVLEYVVRQLKALIKVMEKVLKFLGMTLMYVLGALRAVIAWDKIVDTEVAIASFIMYVRDQSWPYMENNRERVVGILQGLRGSVDEKISTVIATIQGKQGFKREVVDAATQKRADYAFITDAVATNMDKLEINAPEGALKQLEGQLDIIEKDIDHVPTGRAQLELVRLQLSTVGIGRTLVEGVLRLCQLVFDFLEVILQYSIDLTMRLINLGVELFWIVTTWEVKIPIITPLFHYFVSNGKFELSIMTLSTLPSAIVYTYGYMMTHWGSAPFPQAQPEDLAGIAPITAIPKIDASVPQVSGDEQTDGQTDAAPQTNVDSQVVDTQIVDPNPQVSHEEVSVSVLTKRELRSRNRVGEVITALVTLAVMIVFFQVMLVLFVSVLQLAWSLPVGFFVLLIFFLVVFQ